MPQTEVFSKLYTLALLLGRLLRKPRDPRHALPLQPLCVDAALPPHKYPCVTATLPPHKYLATLGLGEEQAMPSHDSATHD